MLAGTFLLVWIVLASANRLVYDNAASDEDKHGFGDRATHGWETTCAGSLSGWFCALLCMIAGLSCLALWAAPLKDTRASMVRDSKQTCGRAAMHPIFTAGLALVGASLAWLVLSWYVPKRRIARRRGALSAGRGAGARLPNLSLSCERCAGLSVAARPR